MLGAGLIGRRLQRAEQEVEPARLVGADLRQLARRFRRLFLLPRRRGVRVLRRRRNRRRRDDSGEKNCGQAVARGRESQCHHQSLDAEKPAAKQQGRQRPVKARIFVEALTAKISLRDPTWRALTRRWTLLIT